MCNPDIKTSLNLGSNISHSFFCIGMIVDSLKKSLLFLLHGSFPKYFPLNGCIHQDCRRKVFI